MRDILSVYSAASQWWLQRVGNYPAVGDQCAFHVLHVGHVWRGLTKSLYSYSMNRRTVDIECTLGWGDLAQPLET